MYVGRYYVCMYVCMCICVCTYVCVYVCMYVRMYVGRYVYTHVCMILPLIFMFAYVGTNPLHLHPLLNHIAALIFSSVLLLLV
jgi:hypothetical protein